MTVEEIARKVFELALSLAGDRLRKTIGDKIGRAEVAEALVERSLAELRHDFEQAVIALRFELMGLQVVELDQAVERHAAEAVEAYERGKAIADGMDVEVVDDPDATPELGVPVAKKPDNE
jgi:hypothetical protein